MGTWGFQTRARNPLDGLPWLILPLFVLCLAARPAVQGKIETLRAAYLGIAVFLVVDVLLRNPFLVWTPLALSVGDGTRFYGIGGAASGLLVGAGLLGAFFLGDRLERLALWAAVVILTLLVPTVGGDTGGAIAALAGFVVLGLLNAPVEHWGRRVLWLGVPVGLFLAGILTVYLFRNGLEGFLAARTPVRWFAHPEWWMLLLGLAAICYYLWRLPDARLKREEYTSLLGVFLASGIFLLADNSGAAAAASCLLCALPVLTVANTRYWREGEGPEEENDESEEGGEPTPDE